MKTAFQSNILPFSKGQTEQESSYVHPESGLLYCTECHSAKQIRLNVPALGEQIVPILCQCQREAHQKATEQQRAREHFQKVQHLKNTGIHDKSLRTWTFQNDNGQNAHIAKAKRYVDQWQRMKAENIGLLLWGNVGSGKSYVAACIANALLEQNIPVLMTNFSKILNTLNSLYKEDRNKYIQDLNRYSLLVIDDLGIERNTEYALEQVYNIIDARYTAGKPLIVTTNLHLDDIREPEDLAHERMYSRILEMCVPIRFTGEDLRKNKASAKMELAVKLFEDV